VSRILQTVKRPPSRT
jgi:putative transposase